MAFPLLMRAVLTVALVGAGGLCLRRCLVRTTGSTTISRFNDATHVLMSVEMIAMAWSWSVPDPFGLQTMMFAVAAGWYVVQATGVPLTVAAFRPALAAASADPPTDTSSSTQCSGRAGHSSPSRTQCLHHAVLMVTMIWMLGVASSPLRSTSMAEMVMPAGASSISGLMPIVGAYCLLVAFVWGIVLIRGRRRHTGAAVVRNLGAAPLMTTAMGLMLVMMR